MKPHQLIFIELHASYGISSRYEIHMVEAFVSSLVEVNILFYSAE